MEFDTSPKEIAVPTLFDSDDWSYLGRGLAFAGPVGGFSCDGDIGGTGGDGGGGEGGDGGGGEGGEGG